MDAPQPPRVASTADVSPRQRYTIGAIAVAIGAFIIAIALRWIDIAPTRGTPYWIVGLAGSVFALAGVALLLPRRRSRAQDVLAALLFSAFAAIGLWVGFGPGEREFSGSMSAGPIAVGGTAGEGIGRAVFGAMGIVVALIAGVAWRRVFRPRASTGAPAR